MGVWSFELGKFARKVENWEKLSEYEKCNTYHQTFINFIKLLFCFFGKHSDLILGLNTLRKISDVKASFKNFQSLFVEISRLGIKDTFLHWE